jgi:hypothetical protein
VPHAAAQKRAAPVPLMPVPFAYVGTLDQGSERYAVLAARDQSVLLVRAGETINNQYRVQSIAEERLMIVNLASGAVQALAREAAPPTAAPPTLATPTAAAPPDAPGEAEPAATAPESPGARPQYGH